MNNHQENERLKEKAKQRINHKIGLTVHAIFWIVISIIISLTVDIKTGLMLFVFFGITVIINFIAYKASSDTVEDKYNDAIQNEYERMKSKKQ